MVCYILVLLPSSQVYCRFTQLAYMASLAAQATLRVVEQSQPLCMPQAAYRHSRPAEAGSHQVSMQLVLKLQMGKDLTALAVCVIVADPSSIAVRRDMMRQMQHQFGGIDILVSHL